jgi:hypothetical protein
LTGLAIAPMAIGMVVAARFSIRVGSRPGHPAAICLGMGLAAAALFGFSTVSASTPYLLYLVYLLLAAVLGRRLLRV